MTGTGINISISKARPVRDCGWEVPYGHYLARSACPYDCPDACGLLVETDGQKIYKVSGDPQHPVTDGFICRKMSRYEDTVNHKERILYPMKRLGKKGRGNFMRISWDEAIKEITDRWKALILSHGPSCILPYSYSGVEHLIQNKCGEAFFNRMGAVRLIRAICSPAKSAGFEQMYGQTPGIFINDIPKSDYIIMWGGNIKTTWLHAARKIVEAKKGGSRVVLIEAYAHDGASLADEVIIVRPGSDGALALSMARVMRDYGLLDKAFLESYTSGHEAFLNSLDAYTPQWAAEITGIAPCVIVSLALSYGRALAPLIVFGSGYSRHGNGAMTTRCIAALPALVGAFSKPGGGYLAHINSGQAFNRNIIKQPGWFPENGRTINMNQLAKALSDKAQPIYSLYVYNSNPANVAPAQRQVLEGLLREDLFTVVHERFMTDTAKYADIILPADMSVEHGDIVTPYGALCVQKIAPVVSPPGECKSNWDTFILLAAAMGYDDDLWKLTNEQLVEKISGEKNPWREQWDQAHAQAFEEGLGVVLPLPDALDFKTESGKILLYNERLEEPMPAYRPNYSQRLTGSNEGWLALVIAPAKETLNSTFTEQNRLKTKRGPACLKINPTDAKERGIRHMDLIEASNDLASVLFYALVTRQVPKGTAVAEGVYDMESMPGGLSVNALLSSRLSDFGEASTLCDNAIKIRLAAAAAQSCGNG